MWALPLLAIGLGLIACAVLIPAADENRALADEKGRLIAELQSLERQEEVNGEFLDRLHADSELAARLVARLKPPAPDADVTVLLPGSVASAGMDGVRFDVSPFALLHAEPVIAPPASIPGGGMLADLCRGDRSRLLILGCGLFACMMAVLGGGSSKP